MAKVEYGSIIVNISGSIGGITFQTNRSGKIARLKPYSNHFPSILQNQENVDFCYYANLYNALTFDQKTAWLLFADTNTFTNRNGTVKRINAFNFFFLVNKNLANFSLPALSDPPLYITGTAVGNYSVKLYNDALKCEFALPQNVTADGALIFTTPPLRSISTSFNRHLRLTQIENIVNFQNLDITSKWTETHNLVYPFSTIPDLYQIGVMIVYINLTTGLSSVGLRKISSSQNTGSGIGSMIIGDDFIVY